MKWLSKYSFSHNLIIATIITASIWLLWNIAVADTSECGTAHWQTFSSTPMGNKDFTLCTNWAYDDSFSQTVWWWEWLCKWTGLSECNAKQSGTPAPANIITCTNSFEQANVDKCILETGITDPTLALQQCALDKGFKTCSVNTSTCEVDICTDSQEQTDYLSCIVKNDFVAWSWESYTCITGNNFKTCGLVENHCTDPIEQSKYNACVADEKINDPVIALQKCGIGLWLKTCTSDTNSCNNTCVMEESWKACVAWLPKGASTSTCGTMCICKDTVEQAAVDNCIQTTDWSKFWTLTIEEKEKYCIEQVWAKTCMGLEEVAQDGVCGNADGWYTEEFPIETYTKVGSIQLCSVGLPFLQQVHNGPTVTYTWSCIGIWEWAAIAECESYQTPQEDDVCSYPNTDQIQCTDPIDQQNFDKCILENNITDPTKALLVCVTSLATKSSCSNSCDKDIDVCSYPNTDQIQCTNSIDQQSYDKCVLENNITDPTLALQQCVTAKWLKSCSNSCEENNTQTCVSQQEYDTCIASWWWIKNTTKTWWWTKDTIKTWDINLNSCGTVCICTDSDEQEAFETCMQNTNWELIKYFWNQQEYCINQINATTCTINTQPIEYYGACGTASGWHFASMPMTNLCDINTNNTATTVWDSLWQDGTYNWSCGLDHDIYGSVQCSAYRVSDGVCGIAAGGITSTFPSENLCASGTPYLQQVTSGNITLYTWSCLGIGTGAYIANCTAYQTPTTDTCIPYGQSGTNQYNINNVILPGTNVALMLNYNYNEGDFANVANNAIETTSGTLASAANVDYTNASIYTLNGIVNSSMSLQVSFTNLNEQGIETGQFIQYRQPADISARSARSSLKNRLNWQAVLEQETIVGSNWYWCNPWGWRTSLVWLVPSQILNQVSTTNVINNSNGSVFGRFSSTWPIGNDDNTDDDNNTVTWLNQQQWDLSYQNNDGERIVFIAQLPGWINVNDEAERFLYWDQPGKWFKVECNLCATTTPVTTQTGTCVDLPDHAIPNIATEIIQYTGANGWFPSTTYTYNPVTSTTDCTFVCENNYHWENGECLPDTPSQNCVGTLPAHTTPNSGTTFVQTRNGTTWVPSIVSWTYNTNGWACTYQCDPNYTRNSTTQTCNPNTQIASCTGTLPANATATSGTTFIQTRNGTTWVPASGSYTTWSGICSFNCNSGYTRNDTTQTCVQNSTLTYSRWTGDWSTCTTTGDIATWWANTYTWDIGTWGPCTPAVGSGTCEWYYPTAWSWGSCTNSATNNGFAAGCATMNITYNIGRWDGNGAGGSLWDLWNGVTLYGNASYCSTLTNPSACNAATSSNCRWFDPGGLGSTSTSLSTCQQASTQTACVWENIYVPGNDFWGIPYSYQSGGITWCSWTPSTYMQTCHDMDGNAFGEFACTFFRPWCTWNATGTAGSAQYRPIVCRDQNGTIVADSLCPQPKPNAVQACTLNTPVNGTCGSANGHSSSTAPSTNLCTNWTASTVSGNGPWSWTCSWSNGWTNASCSASVTTSSTCTLDTTVGWGCFIADTLVIMADGSSKAIQDIKVGEKLKAVDGINTVVSLLRPLLWNKDIYSINGQKAFFTANHPFLTTDGWKSLDPDTTKKEIPDLEVSKLTIGDILITEHDNVLVVSINSAPSASSTQLYNFELDGDHTYFANGFAVHNKLAPGSSDGQLWDSCVQNNDCRTSVAGKPPMACDNNTKTCKYTRPYPWFMCQMDNNGNLTNWDGPWCGDWATPNYVGEGCNQTLPEDWNLYTCQSNGNRSTAWISCVEEIVDMENWYTPWNTVCATTTPQDCICTANQYEPVCITQLWG